VGRQSQTARRNAGSVSPNHLGSGATSTNETASTTFLGIVHLIVESTTFYGAVAKGGAAANLLSANEAEPAVDDYTLIYDPTRRRRASWSSNGPHPRRGTGVVGRGRAASQPPARDGAGWHEQGASERQEQAPRRLYDQHGDGIRDASRLNAVLDDADDAVWLVPAMALTESAREDKTNSQVSLVPTSQDPIVKPVDGRPTTSSRSTSRSRLRRGRANRSGSAGCVVRLATDPVSSSSSAGRRLTNISTDASEFRWLIP